MPWPKMDRLPPGKTLEGKPGIVHVGFADTPVAAGGSRPLRSGEAFEFKVSGTGASRDVDQMRQPTEENSMQALQADYFSAYHNLKLSRDDKGVLVAEFHSDGGRFIMNAQS